MLILYSILETIFLHLSINTNLLQGPEQQPSPNRKTKATLRLAKDWEYVAGMDTMILVSLQYARDAKKLVFGIIKVANLKVLPNNKKPGNAGLSTLLLFLLFHIHAHCSVKKNTFIYWTIMLFGTRTHYIFFS